jgi:hypothetical protein
MRQFIFGALVAISSALVPVTSLHAQEGDGATYGWCKATSAGTLYYSEIWTQSEDEAGYSPGEWFSRQLNTRTQAVVADLSCMDGQDKAAMETQRNADMAAARAAGSRVALLR